MYVILNTCYILWWKGVIWIHLVLDRVRWRHLVKTVPRLFLKLVFFNITFARCAYLPELYFFLYILVTQNFVRIRS
jgi:hypothetical protein